VANLIPYPEYSPPSFSRGLKQVHAAFIRLVQHLTTALPPFFCFEKNVGEGYQPSDVDMGAGFSAMEWA